MEYLDGAGGQQELGNNAVNVLGQRHARFVSFRLGWAHYKVHSSDFLPP